MDVMAEDKKEVKNESPKKKAREAFIANLVKPKTSAK
jgi:hypothetical protein